MEEPLRLVVGLDQLALRVRATRESQIVDGLRVDGEEAHGRAVLGRHVGDGRAVGQRQRGDAGAEELDELPDDALLAQHLRDGEHEVGRGRAGVELPVHAEADDLWNEHRDRLTEQRRFGLDAAHAPAEHAEAVDHGGVRVGADDGVWVRDAVLLHHRRREVLEVHLVADAHVGRHHAETLEGLLSPTQELVALAVALHLELRVEIERVVVAEVIDHDGVIDDEIGGLERVDAVGVAAERDDRFAHRREIDDGRHAREVLHEHARGIERDLAIGLGLRIPVEQRLDVALLDDTPVFLA